MTGAALMIGGGLSCGGKAGRAPLEDARDSGDVDRGEIETSLDTLACAARPAGHCETLRTTYNSNDAEVLSMNPELSGCAAFISFDGCGRLVFSFDRGGCLESELSSPDGDDHLGSLRRCFAAGLGFKRWPCLADGTVTFNESCFFP